MASSPHDHEDAAEVARLPLETRCPPYPLRQYGGFWMPEPLLQGTMAARARFEPRPSDVFLASFPKSGTTWLKALAFATLNRAGHPPRHREHPLRRRNPHDCVKFLEMMRHSGAAFAASHLHPHALPPPAGPRHRGGRLRLPDRLRLPGPQGRLRLHLALHQEQHGGAGLHGPGGVRALLRRPLLLRPAVAPRRRLLGGEPRRRPGKVLFLRYEEMLRDPARHVRKLAEFMGCAFSDEEAVAGVVEEIVELCSLDVLKNMEGNRNGTQSHMTPAMAARLDKIVDDALRGSGFTFAVTNPT